LNAINDRAAAGLALVLTVAAGIAAGGCAGRLHPYTPVDLDQLKRERGRVEELLRKHADHKGVFLNYEAVREHHVDRGSGYWSQHDLISARWIVIDPKHKPLTEFDWVANKGFEIVQADVVVLPPGGEPRRFTERDLVREKRRNKRTGYKLAYPAVTRGTLIEVHIEYFCADPRNDGTLGVNFRLRKSHPTERSVARFVFPSTWDVLIKLTPAGKRPPVAIRTVGDKTEVSAVRHDLPAQPAAIYAPYFQEDGEVLKFYVRSARTPNMVRYITRSWTDRAKNFVKYVVNNDAVFSSRVAQKTREVVDGIQAPLGRFKAIIQYVQHTIQEDEEWDDKDFARVLQTKRGSPYQITGLTHMMLREAGLDARFVLIHSAADGHFDEIFVSSSETDVAAVMARIDGKAHLALPWKRGLPAGVLPANLQGRKALKITDKGFDGFFTTPVTSADKDRRVDRFTVQLTPDGALRVSEVRSYHGLAAYEARRALEDLKPAELDKQLRKWLTYSEGEVKVTTAVVRHREALEQPLVIAYDYTIDNLVALAGDEAIMQTAGLLSPSTSHDKLDEEERRIRPLRSYRAHIYEREVDLRFPAGWTLTRAPKDATFENRLGQVTARYDAGQPGALRVRQVRKMKRFDLPPAAFKELVQLLGQRGALAVPTLVFRTGAAAPASRPTAQPER